MISLIGFELRLKENYQAYKVGEEFYAVDYTPDTGQIWAICKASGILVRLNEKICTMFKPVEIPQGSPAPAQPEEPVAEGTLKWLKGKITTLENSVKELKHGNNN